jgi:DNA replicative helicase MCM subunit Mcm2 (Cdc46/Mcm family)
MVDETTELMDERIAQHIVDLHRNPKVGPGGRRAGPRAGAPPWACARGASRAGGLRLRQPRRCSRRAPHPRLTHPLSCPAPQAVTHAVPFATEAMQRYIKYARAIKPELTQQVWGRGRGRRQRLARQRQGAGAAAACLLWTPGAVGCA